MALLTKHRPRPYVICEGDALATALAFIFDGERASTIYAWRVANETKAAPSIMLVPAGSDPVRGAVRVQRPMVASLLLNALDALPIERSVVTAATAVGASASRNEQPSERASSQPEKRTIANFRAEIDSRTAPPVAAPPADTLLPRALVIDDSPTVRKRLELALRAAYVDVDAAVTGEDGLQLIATRNYDIVFLDVVLPGEDGYKICKTIKNDPSLRHTPVVMLTSRSSPFDRIRGSLAGCNSYLTKPVDKGLFEKTLKKYVPNAIISGKADGVPLVSA